MKLYVSLILVVTMFLNTFTQGHAEEDCTGIVSSDPTLMYDFKIGEWDINWRNKTGPDTVFEFTAFSKAYAIQDGDIMLDEQTSDLFKGVTFRTYDTENKHWLVRWLPANSDFPHPITAQLENCVPVERHHQILLDGREIDAVTKFADISESRFLFRQDWSFDGGKTWVEDVLTYEAVRRAPD